MVVSVVVPIRITITNNLNCGRVLNLSIGVNAAASVNLLADSLTCLGVISSCKSADQSSGSFNINGQDLMATVGCTAICK
ncbi:MAG: hypothetical protein IPI30_23755 [Saprospiraceae bacterium]|nr:hypothetical protein [Candidatus Vicinibacter affinis]